MTNTEESAELGRTVRRFLEQWGRRRWCAL